MFLKFPELDIAQLRFSWLISSRQQNNLLRRIVDRVRHSLELKTVLQTAVDEISQLFHLEDCLFFWYFEDTRRIQVVCEQGSHSKQVSRLGYHALEMLGYIGTQIAEGQLIVGGPASGGLFQTIGQAFGFLPAMPPSSDLFCSTQPHLFVPVTGREGVKGYLACLSGRSRHWSTQEIDLIRAIAESLEIAIQQAYLYEQTQKQAQREYLVNQITTQTRQSFDLKTILTQAIDQLMIGLKADRCLVHLVEAIDSAEMEQAALSGSIRTEHGEASCRRHLYEVCRSPFPPSIDDFDMNGPITQWVVQHRRPVVISDVTQDQRIGPYNLEYQKAQIQSSLVMPVQANGTLHAILYLNQCTHARYWSINDQNLVQAVADQLAISIQQAHLYAQTQRQAADSAAQAKYLAETLRELQLTQAQLIQSEKLSSLGRMVAGVAHEINNPVGFIYGNLPYIERYCRDLLRLLEAYRTLYPNPTPELQNLTQEIELDFLVQDLFLILSSINIGAARIRDVVTSLRNFSRLDESNRKTVDLHDGLESTLSILQVHLQDDIHLIRDYGNLPPVECYPKLLNQVFMNVLMNAIEAVQRSQTQPKVVRVQTEIWHSSLTGEPLARITIADNGPGIPPDIQSKIFDPFFTTKDIGQGSGLGLAVSYQTIVNQHRGSLRCYSNGHTGTEFVIEVPIRHSKLLVTPQPATDHTPIVSLAS